MRETFQRNLRAELSKRLNLAVYQTWKPNPLGLDLSDRVRREGRWDELFSVDLPNQAEREAIWQIQIAKYGCDPTDFDLVQLALSQRRVDRQRD